MSPGPRVCGTRRILAAGEVALALMLLIGAGLMVKSAWRMHAYPPGFEPRRVLTAKIEFAGPITQTRSAAWPLPMRCSGRVTDRPGVEAASISTHGYMLSPGFDGGG